MGTFALDVSAFVRKTKAKPDIVIRKIGLDLLRRIVLRTPVGNPDLWKGGPKSAPKGYTGGRLRGNWQVSIGAPVSGPSGMTDKGGGATIEKGSRVMLEARAGQIIWLVNNLPYAMAIEFGHSKQAPAGMVRITIEEFQAIVGTAAGEANSV